MSGQVTKVSPQLYGADGQPLVRAAQAPDFDPAFLMSFAETWSAAGQLMRKVTEQPYQYYVWVYACASAISGNLARLQPRLYAKDDPNKVLTEHPILKLFRRPNPYMTGSQFMEAIVLNLMLPTHRTPGGQCFLIPDDEQPTDFSRGQVPRTLYPFSDQYVFPLQDKVNGQLLGWELKIPGKTPLRFDVDEVIRIHLYNPYSLLLGMSPYSAAVYAIEGDTKAQELSRKFADNGANVGGMLSTDKPLSKPQAQDLRAEWAQMYGGTGNAGKTAILHSGLKFEQTSRSLTDLQFIEGRRLNREEILAAYKVPPFVVGQYADINYATSVMAQRSFWQETLVPYLEKVWEPINSQWVENLDGGRYRGFSDTSVVEALRKDYKDKVGIADTMITKHGISVADAYRMLDIDLDITGKPWLELPLVIGPRVNLEDGSIVGQMDFGGAAAALANEDNGGDGTGQDPKPPKGEGKHSKFLARVAGLELRSDARDQFWLGWVKRTLNPGEKKLQVSLTRYLVHQRNAMLDNVDAWAATAGGVKALLTRAVTVEDFLLSLADENATLAKLVSPIYDTGIEAQAAQMTDELGDLVNWNQQSAYVERYKKRRIRVIQNINTSTFKLASKLIGQAITDGMANNLTVQELANTIRDGVSQTYGVRLGNSQTIARTEMASIATTTRFSIMEKEGIEQQEWLSARDEKVRLSHSEEDGHVVDVGTRFPITNLMHPCEMGAAPGEVINCRCTVIPVKA